MKKRRENLKVFIGMMEVAGYNTSLRDGFRSIGIDIQYVDIFQDVFEYNNEFKTNFIISNLKRFKKRRELRHNFVNETIHALFSILFLIWGLLKFDIFIFASFNSFLRLRDLKILKYFNKKIIYIFYGSESRPAYLNGKYLTYSFEDIRKKASNQKATIKLIERYADIIISHPPSGQFHEKPFIIWHKIGFPVNLQSFKTDHKLSTCDVLINILHAPSSPVVKGTDLIISVINELISEGYRIKLEIIKNMPNSVVIEKLQHCDFIVDELYSDTFMARFATEAAFFGKPTIVCGYIKKHDLGKIDEELIPPVLQSNPKDLKQLIKALIDDKSLRLSLGSKAKTFVLNKWSSSEIAMKYELIFNKKIDDSWFCDPLSIDYIYGFGVDKEILRNHLNAYINKFGKDALYMDHNPKLRDKLIDFSLEKK